MRRAIFQSTLLVSGILIACSIAVTSDPAEAKRIRIGVSSGSPVVAQNSQPSADAESNASSSDTPAASDAKAQAAINAAAAARARKVLAAEEAGDTVTVIGGQVNSSANGVVCIAGCYK